MRSGLIILLAFSFFGPLSGQDFHFVNSFQLPQLFNAAATGGASVHRTQVATLYRGQWDNTVSAQSYQGGVVFADMRFCLQNSKKSFYALGLGLQHDFSPLGGLYNTQAALNGAYHQHLGRETFGAVGANIGGLAMGLQPGSLRFDAQYQNGNYDPDRSNGEDFLRQNLLQPDIGAGFLLYNNADGWSAGASWRHINKPKYSLLDDENRLGIGLVLHGNYTVWKTKSNTRNWQLRGLYRRQSVTGANSAQWQAMAGGFFQIAFSGPASSRLTGGAYLRAGSLPNAAFTVNTLVPVLQLGNDRFTAILSYDIDIARIRSRFAGGMEMMFATRFGKTDRCVVCSRF